jgi:hypothetical protein
MGRGHLEDLGVDGKTLKWVLRTSVGRAWTGWMWVRRGTSGRLVAVTLCRWPGRVQVGPCPTCTRHGHRQLRKVVLTQFVSPDDEHDVLEICRELKI